MLRHLSSIGYLTVLATCLAGCAAMFHQSDLANPCSYKGSIECERWKKDFPKEYAKYKARMKKNADTKTSTSAASTISTSGDSKVPNHK